MKRRIISLLLALVLLVSLFPMTVLAEDTQTEAVLKMRVPAWKDGVETTVDTTDIDMNVFHSLEAQFILFTADGTETEIPMEELTFSDNLIYAWNSYDDQYYIEATAVGEGRVTYTADGTEYAVTINVTYPDLGLYTGMPFDESTLVDEIQVDEENETFYIALAPHILAQGSKMTEVHKTFGDEIQRPSITDIGEFELAADGTYAKVILTDAQASGNYHFHAKVENTNPNGGPNGTWGRSIWIESDMPKLYRCWLSWGSDTEGWTYDFQYPQDGLWCAPGDGYRLGFFFGRESDIQNGNGTPVALSDLTFPAYLSPEVFTDYGTAVPDNALRVNVTGFPEETDATAITYTYNNKVYSMPVTVELPDIGFYTEPAASEEAFIYDGNPFVVTEEDRTFYLCVSDTDRYKLKEITDWYPDGSEELFTTELSDDSSYMTVTVKDGATVSNRNYNVDVTVERYTGSYWREDLYGAGVRLKHGAPGLMYRYLSWDDENQIWYEEPNREFETVVDLDYGESMPVQFYYGTEDAGYKVDLSELTFPAGIARGYMRENVAWVEALGFDETGFITYQTGDTTAKLAVRTEQPFYGLYSSNTASKATYLDREITLGGEDCPEVYLIAREGETIQQIGYIRNNRTGVDVTDQFNVQLAVDGSHAIISLKPDNTLEGGIYYEMRIHTQYGGYYHRSFRLYRGDLEQLATPTNLVWHKEYWQWRDENGNWTLETNDRMGEMAFEVYGLFQNHANVEIYSAEDGYTTSVEGGSWGFGSQEDRTHFSISDFIYAELPSGTYKFRIRSEGDGTQYRNSDWSALSGEFVYVQPDQQLTAPDASKLKWIKNDYGYAATWPAEAGQQTGAGYFETIFFWEDENGVKHQSGGTFDIHVQENNGRSYYEAMIHDDMLEQHGDVNYYFKVRVIPADITAYRASAFSGFSPALDVNNISLNVNSQLEQLLPDTTQGETTDVQEVQDTLQNSTADLRTAMAADLELSGGTSNGTLELIQQLEAAVSDTVDQKVDAKNSAPQAIQDIASGVTMIGATLNLADKHPETGKTPTVTLELDAPKAGIVIGEQQHNAVQFSMKLNGAIDKDDKEEAGQQLIVPVVIDMPVPAGINPDFLVVLHKLWDGTIEELRPYIYEKDSAHYARFVVDSFSDFALIDSPFALFATDEETIDVQTFGIKPQATNVFAAVYAENGQMLDIVPVDSAGLAVLENDPKIHTIKIFCINDQYNPLDMIELDCTKNT